MPGQHYLGSQMVADKSNEIPAARDLFERLDLDGKEVSLDALHTQAETARALVLEHGADYLLTVKANQATVQENSERRVTSPPVAFPSEGSTTLARTHERNKSRTETRTLHSAPVIPKSVGFPFASQAARLRREEAGRPAETVALITSLPPTKLTAARWLERNRQHWGIEDGLHACLDVSRRDDQCRLGTRAVRPLGQQPVPGIAKPPIQARAQIHHRLCRSHGCRPVSPGVAHSHSPPTQPPLPFVNTP